MTGRTTAHPTDPLFLARWSPRAFDGAPMPETDLLTMIDAARWAPSAFNYQPWRFLYALQGGADWNDFLALLNPFNQRWAARASALVVIVSDTLMQQSEAATVSHSHSFDTGAAWAQFALQATRLGYQAHGMTGIDFDRTRDTLGIPEHFRIEAAAAVGRIGDAATLPEGLRAREMPSDRKPLAEIAVSGRFRG